MDNYNILPHSVIEETIKKQLEKDIMKFRISVKSLSISKKKKELEKYLTKVETRIKLFIKDVFYVTI